MATVRDALEEAIGRLRDSGSESARLDAELLLAHVVSVDRSTILAYPESPLGEEHVAEYRSLVERRASGEPVAYIRGLKEFYGLSFAVDKRALIPRPETERLVEIALARIVDRLTRAARPSGTPPLRILDVGTGSGAVAVALATVLRRRGFAAEIRLEATDSSEEALSLATENAVAHGVADLIVFRGGDLLEGLPVGAAPFDVLVANLPYVPSDRVPELPIAARFEPRDALDGGIDGLAVVRRLLPQLPAAVTKDGVALLEIGANQARTFREAVDAELPGWSLEIYGDLSGRPRVAELSRSAEAASGGGLAS
jgi:release factor glutamine methyltransferase